MAGADTARSGARTVGETRPPDPPVLTRALVSMRLRVADLLDTVSGRRDRLTPPRRLSLYVGHGDFRAMSEFQLRAVGDCCAPSRAGDNCSCDESPMRIARANDRSNDSGETEILRMDSKATCNNFSDSLVMPRISAAK